MVKKTILTFGALVVAAEVAAAVLEVGPGRACRTIQAAADVARAGDVVLIDPGVYREWVKPANAGTKDSPITYRARVQGKVVVTGADVVTGWRKRADGLWEVKLPYDRCGGFNPFTEFISGNWYRPPYGVRNPRTALFRGRKRMFFRESVGEFGQPYPCPEYLLNVAGLIVEQRVIAGASAELTGTAKPLGQTDWGREVGCITPGSTLTFGRFPKVMEFELCFSGLRDDGCIEFRDGSSDGDLLGTSEYVPTLSWTKYATLKVKLAKTPETGRLTLVFKLNDGYGRRALAGSYTMRAGMAAGTIIADFKEDPNDGNTELVMRPCCFYPIVEFRDYIRLDGIVFRDAGPNWAGPHAEQLGVVGTNWSKGWVIEDCEISGSPCAGLTLGKHGDEFDNYSGVSQRYTEAIERAIAFGQDRVGGHAVRRCRIRDCGQAGICGSLGAVFSTIEGCDIGYCHWNENFDGSEQACIKLHAAVDVVIADNDLHHAGDIGGIWLDWMAQGTRVTGNRIHDLDLSPRRVNASGIFVEVSHGPVIVDNNVIIAAKALEICGSQSVAYVGNILYGSVSSRGGLDQYLGKDEPRRTPIFEPHSVALREMHNSCAAGGHRFINNVMTCEPPQNSAFANICEDNAVVPPECWRIRPHGAYEIMLPKGFAKPSFRPVDTRRLGVSELGRQPYENRDGTPYRWEPVGALVREFGKN